MNEPIPASSTCSAPSASAPEEPTPPSRPISLRRLGLRLCGLVLPGGGQLANGETGKAAAYAVLSLASIAWAWFGNRAWLDLYWRFKELEASSVFLRDYYAEKQEALLSFLGLYLIVLAASNVDALLNRPSPSSTE